jgi:hypothetical protein
MVMMKECFDGVAQSGLCITRLCDKFGAGRLCMRFHGAVDVFLLCAALFLPLYMKDVLGLRRRSGFCSRVFGC